MSVEQGRLSRADQTTITRRFHRAAYKMGSRLQKKGTFEVARRHWRRLPSDLRESIAEVGVSYDPSVSDIDAGLMHRSGAAIMHGFMVGSAFGYKLASGQTEKELFHASLGQLIRAHLVRDEFAEEQARETLERNGGVPTRMIRTGVDSALVTLHKPLLDTEGSNYAYDHDIRSLYSLTVGYVAAVALTSQIESVMSLRQNTLRRRFGLDSGYSQIRQDADALAAGETVLDTFGIQLFMTSDETSLPIEEPRSEE